MRILEKQVFCFKEHILFAKFDDGGVVFNLETREGFEVNQAGAGILELLDGTKDVGEIDHAIVLAADQEEELLKEDVHHFLMNLYQRGWIHVQ